MFSNTITAVVLGGIAAVLSMAAPAGAEEAEKIMESYAFKPDIPYRNKKTETHWDEYMASQCRVDLYYPENAGGFRTIVYFHGGGLRSGGKYVPEKLKGHGVAIAAVGYRLSPKVKSPAFVDDAAAATAWVLKHIHEYGGDSSRVYVSGHSAGGYLAAMVGFNKTLLARYGADADRIAGLIPLSGQMATHATIRLEQGRGRTDITVDEMAPLYHVRGDCPPVTLITGDRELEMWGRYEENAYLWRLLKLAGHKNVELYEMQGFDHGGMRVAAFELLLQAVTRDR